jgi:hypothetical protein
VRRTRVVGVLRGAAAVIAAGIACAAATQVGAAPPLSSVVITRPLPGFVVDPPSSDTGYLTPLDADQPGLGLSSDLVEQYGADGDLTSYARAWRDPVTGDGLEMIATRFVNPSLIPLFVQGVAGMHHNTAFRMDGKFGAQGYSLSGTMAGVGFDQYVVMATVGNTVFVTTLLTRGDLNAFDAFKVAQEQVQSVAGPSGTGTSWWPVSRDATGLLALAVVALVALAVWWRRSKRPRPHRAFLDTGPVLEPPPPSPSRRSSAKAARRSRSEATPPVVVPRRRPRDPGWVYLEWDLNVRCYWDGRQWTERQEWNPDDRGWVTTPLAPLEHSRA